MVSIDFEWSQVCYLMNREDVDRIYGMVMYGTEWDFNYTASSWFVNQFRGNKDWENGKYNHDFWNEDCWMSKDFIEMSVLSSW